MLVWSTSPRARETATTPKPSQTWVTCSEVPVRKVQKEKSAPERRPYSLSTEGVSIAGSVVMLRRETCP